MLSKMILLTAVFFRIAAPIADELASAFVAHDSEEAMPYLTHYGILCFLQQSNLGGRDPACDQVFNGPRLASLRFDLH